MDCLTLKTKILQSFKIVAYTYPTTQDITFSSTIVTTSNLTANEIFKVFHRSSMTMLYQYFKKSHMLFYSCPPKFITHIQFSTTVKLGFHVFKFICSWILCFCPPPPNFHKHIQFSLNMSVPPIQFLDYKFKVSIFRPVTVVLNILIKNQWGGGKSFLLTTYYILYCLTFR